MEEAIRATCGSSGAIVWFVRRAEQQPQPERVHRDGADRHSSTTVRRDVSPSPRPAGQSRTEPHDVIGAGPAGLVAAATLARAGQSVHVIDRASEVGHRFSGRIQGLENWSTPQDVLRRQAVRPPRPVSTPTT